MSLIRDEQRKWWVLAAMGAILGVILLDETVVGVALPTIQLELSMSEIASHWVINVYMLLLAGLAAAAGKLGDVAGHGTLATIGLAIFGFASLACGFATDGTLLIVARGVQGAGAAIIFPASLAMVMIAFPERQRGLALGAYGAIGTVFLALGPLVGGVLTDAASWRWIFWINPPIVLLIALIIAAAWTEPPRRSERQRLDMTGLVLLVGGLSLTVFALMQGPDWGWVTPAVSLSLTAGVALLVAFVVFERRHRMPLIEVDLFFNRTFAASNLVIFTAQYSKMAVFVFGALYLQDILGMTALFAGLALLPTVAPQPFTAPLAGHVVDRFGTRSPTLCGIVFLLAGILWIGIAVSSPGYAWLLPGLLIWGLSMAFLFVPPQHAVMNSVPVEKQGQAGGIVMSSQLLGATIGMAIGSTIFSTTNDFQYVFLSNAALVAVVLVVAWLAMDRPEQARTSK